MSTNIRINRICQFCNQEFEAKTTVTKFCSLKCAQRNYKAQKRAEKVEKSHIETKTIIAKPLEELKAKEFLSISEICKLVGVSRRTIYRCIERGDLQIGKFGKRTIIRRSDIDKLFEPHAPILKPKSHDPLNPSSNLSELDTKDYYTVGEAQHRFGISETALHKIIQRENIPKVKRGKHTFIPKTPLDQLFKPSLEPHGKT